MQKQSDPIWKVLGGMVAGVLLTYAYVRFGYSLPWIVQAGGKMTSEAMVATAEIDLYDPVASDDVRHRALAIVVGLKPELFIDVDDAIGNQFFEEVLRRKAVRKAKLMKHRPRAYRMALDKPALRRVYEKRFGVSDDESLERSMFEADIRDDEYLYGYLRRRFPEASLDDMAELILDVYQSGLKTGETATARHEAINEPALRR